MLPNNPCNARDFFVHSLDHFFFFLQYIIGFIVGNSFKKVMKLTEFNFVFFKGFLLVLTKFACWQEDWTLGYYSMNFPDIS